jgi:very-long-chain (3R)-3-hydroxyacyl-CoA dehydratase
MITKGYLIAYNGTLLAGWAYIAAQVVRNKIAGGSLETLYPLIKKALSVSQTAAVLEILHAATGLVRSAVPTTFIQVMSRLIVLWGAVEIGSKSVTSSWWFSQMVVAWSLSELVRYSYYLVGLFKGKKIPAVLTWLRYSAFLVLYPMGITGEIGCLIKALPHIKMHGALSVAMPNKWNVVFNFHTFVLFALGALYPPGAYVMYTHMLKQRSKALLKAKEEAKCE